MKLIIAGGRNYYFSKDDYARLDKISGVTEVISGAARGADSCGEKWAERNNIPVRRFVAQWQRLGKKAGMIRNKDMALYADALAIFPGGSGSSNMKKEAKNKNLQIFEMY
jgi:hypothetical protein